MIDRRTFLRAGVGGICAGTGGCNVRVRSFFSETPVTGAAPAPQYDARRSGHASAVRGPRSSPALRWERTVEEYEGVTPVAHRGGVYVGGKLTDESRSGFAALNALTGDTEWYVDDIYFSTYPPMYGNVSPFVTNEALFLTNRKYLYRVDSGPEIEWEREVGGAGLVVRDDTVYVTRDELAAVDAATGAVRWTTRSLDVSTAPAAGTEGVYVGTYTNTVESWGHDGEYRWQAELGADVICTPTVVEGRVLASTVGHGLHALAVENGNSLWAFEIGAPVYASPAVSDGRVYLGATDGNCYAIDLETGTELWQFDAGGTLEHSFRGGPVCDGDLVYLAGMDGVVYALDAETGTEHWRYDVSEPVSSPLSVVNGFVYVGTEHGRVLALESKTRGENR